MEAPDPDPEPQQKDPESKPSAGPDKNTRNEDVEAMRRELDEVRQTNRSLIDLVGRNTPPKPADKTVKPSAGEDDIDWGDDPDAQDEVDEPEDPATLVDDLSKLGREALAKRGYMRKGDVLKMVREESRKAAVTASRQVVGRARQQATTESTIMQEFPDLADPNSDLFKATIPHVNAAARFNPNAAKDPVTLYQAAKIAQLELNAKKPARRAAPEVDDDEDDDPQPVRRSTRTREDDRDDRDLRIASQQGDRGRQRSRIESEHDDEVVMSSDAKAVAKMMGLSDDEYRTEATRVRKTQSSLRRGR